MCRTEYKISFWKFFENRKKFIPLFSNYIKIFLENFLKGMRFEIKIFINFEAL